MNNNALKLFFALLFSIAVFGTLEPVSAETVFELTRGGTTTAYESTTMTTMGALQNGDIITVYSNLTETGQMIANAVGQDGTVTIQSGTPGTRVQISTNGQRFCDYASGTYILKDIHFYNCSGSGNGGVFYRNDVTSSAYVFDNVLIENSTNSGTAALRAATGMTISGTGEFLNNTNTTTNNGIVHAAFGKLTFTGDSTQITFTGSKFGTGVGYDAYARDGIEFNGTGNYSFGGGLNSSVLNINGGASVTLEAGSKSTFSGITSVNSGTLTFGSPNFTTSQLTLGNTGVVEINTPTLELKNLSSASDARGAVVKVADGYTGKVTLTLNHTGSTWDQYYGRIDMPGHDIIKTGAKGFSIHNDIVASTTTIREGGICLYTDNYTDLTTFSGNLILDGGLLDIYQPGSGFNWNNLYPVNATANDKIFVAENGGTLSPDADRAVITSGIHSADGVESGNLRINRNGGRIFITGTSTFNGYYELANNCAGHFSNEAVASSKGIILNGGDLYYLGQGEGTKALSCPVYIKSSSDIQCGWSGNFHLNGTISDWEGADTSGSTITIRDSGSVWLNGNVNTKARLDMISSLKTEGTNDITIGGLVGSSSKTFQNTATAGSTAKLTLNVAEGQNLTYQGSLSGNFNLVKDGLGTQTLTAGNIGETGNPISSITINDGILGLNGGGKINTNALHIAESGTLALDINEYTIDVSDLSLLGKIQVSIASPTEMTELIMNIPDGADLNGFLTFDMVDGYTLERGVAYPVFKNGLPSMPEGYDYNAWLDPQWRRNYQVEGDGTVIFNFNSVPEPATWVLLVLGVWCLHGSAFGRVAGRFIERKV